MHGECFHSVKKYNVCIFGVCIYNVVSLACVSNMASISMMCAVHIHGECTNSEYIYVYCVCNMRKISVSVTMM
jgi:hypothetical protein